MKVLFKDVVQEALSLYDVIFEQSNVIFKDKSEYEKATAIMMVSVIAIEDVKKRIGFINYFKAKRAILRELKQCKKKREV